MTYRCTIAETPDGRWTARHDSADLGSVEAAAATRDEAVEKITSELRYRLELCPCSGESYQHLQVELVEKPR